MSQYGVWIFNTGSWRKDNYIWQGVNYGSIVLSREQWLSFIPNQEWTRCHMILKISPRKSVSIFVVRSSFLILFLMLHCRSFCPGLHILFFYFNFFDLIAHFQWYPPVFTIQKEKIFKILGTTGGFVFGYFGVLHKWWPLLSGKAHVWF